MMRNASAYAALGLEPGADPVAIERAYKRLIKLYHPDREGGDPGRAAEINRAYRELRSRLGPQDTIILAHDEPAPEPAGRGWIGAATVLIIALAALLLFTGPLRALLPVPPQSVPVGQVAPAARGSDSMDQPLHLAAIEEGVRDAVRIAARHDDPALLAASRECHRQLRVEPSVTQLDRCAAFDDAVVQLQDRDPVGDSGAFSQIAVTSRQWSGASSLSNDYLAIDSRLDRIRLKVELALAPPQPAQPPPPVSLKPVIDPTDAAVLEANAAENVPAD